MSISRNASVRTRNTRKGGLSLLSVVFIVFLVLKLAEIGVVATWSWWWVTAPLWGPFFVAGCLVIGGLIAAVVVHFVDKIKKGRKS